MIAHVAEAGESSGRVVLRFCSGRPNPAAIDAAVRIAQAFQSEVESLFVEDTQLLECARFPFARETSFTGRRTRPLSQRAVRESFMAAFADARRRVECAARKADVPLVHRVVRDEPVHALAAACAQRGPWNVIALAEALAASSCTSIRELFDAVPDTTGLILAGPNSHRSEGPVIVAVEDLERLPGMMHAAERLAAFNDTRIVLLLVGQSAEDLYQMDGEVRLLLAEREDVVIKAAEMALGEAAVIAESIRQLKGGFLIAQFGALAVPESGGLRPLISALECPLFLVR